MKRKYIRNGISDSEVYKGLYREITYAYEHIKRGAEYDRTETRLMAESAAYSMAYKYGLDTSDFRFDCIPDPINGFDGKDLNELVNPIVAASSNEIKSTEKNLSKFRPEEKLPSVKRELQTHKSAVDTGKYKEQVSIKTKKSIENISRRR